LLDRRLLTHVIEDYNIGLGSQYRAVSVGEDLSEVESTDYEPVGKSLIPLAPVHLKGERDESGNLTISWKRRSRGYSGWRDNVDLPLVEKTEKYEIDIMNGENIVRTVEIFEASEYEYTASLQVSDFGSTQSSLTIKLFQISEVVGRGNLREETV